MTFHFPLQNKKHGRTQYLTKQKIGLVMNQKNIADNSQKAILKFHLFWPYAIKIQRMY